MRRCDLEKLLNYLFENNIIPGIDIDRIKSIIERIDAERMIELFNNYFTQNFQTRLTITPELFNIIKNKGRDLVVFFVSNSSGEGLSLVYEDGENYFQLDNVISEVEESNFFHLFKNFQINQQHLLNTKKNPDQLGCPNSITIPFSDIILFDNGLFSHVELITSVFDLIGSSNSSRDNRVSFIMRYVAVNGNINDDLFFDTFDPRP